MKRGRFLFAAVGFILLVILFQIFNIFALASSTSTSSTTSASGSTHSCIDDDDIILRLYYDKNSHGALWNDANYNYEICYSDVFSEEYSRSSPHDCTGDNKVLGLYSSTNSHAEIPSLTNYGTDVCYGELICEADSSSGNDCSDSEKSVVVRLYYNTNSHISDSSYTNYRVKICCKPGKPKVDSANWNNMKGEAITEANLNDRVKLVAKGSGFSGKEVTFEIYKDGFWFFDSTVTSQTSSEGYITWRPDEKGTYYFKASVEGIEATSGDLTVSDSEENSPPVAIIDSPESGSVHSLESDISYEQSSYDEDDFFDYCWKFGDEDICGNSEDYTNYDITHKYTSTGQKTTNLSVIDERGLQDSDLTSILVIDITKTGKYVFAGISSPAYGGFDFNPVRMDASDSFAIEVTLSPLTITCIGGTCPSKAITSSGEITINDYNLDDYSVFAYNWKFDDGTQTSVLGVKTYDKIFATLGWHNAELTVSLISDSSIKSSTKSYFRVLGGVDTSTDYCENGIWIDFDGTSFTEHDPISEADICHGEDGDASATSDNCCPSDYSCEDLDSDGDYYCEIDEYCSLNDIVSCGDYTSKSSCELDSCGVGTTGSGGEECGKTVYEICNEVSSYGVKPEDSCLCTWDDKGTTSDTSDDECIQSGRVGLTIEGINIDFTCILTGSTASECSEDGIMEVSETGEMDWTGVDLSGLYGISIGGITIDSSNAQTTIESKCDLESLCYSGTRSVICNSGAVRLGFFNWINMVVAVIIIGIAYFFLYLKKKRTGRGPKIK